MQGGRRPPYILASGAADDPQDPEGRAGKINLTHQSTTLEPQLELPARRIYSRKEAGLIGIFVNSSMTNTKCG